MDTKSAPTSRPSTLGAKIINIVPSGVEGGDFVCQNVFVPLPPVDAFGGPIGQNVLTRPDKLYGPHSELWNVTVRCLHEQRDFACAMGEGYRARLIEEQAMSLLKWREEWLSMEVVKVAGTVVHDAMLALCESIYTMCEWVKADNRCLNNQSVDAIYFANDIVLCGQEFLYGLVHAIIVGGVKTYEATGGSGDAVLRMWTSSIEECTGRVMTPRRCRLTVNRLFTKYRGATVTIDQLVREVTAAGVRGGRPTALSVIAEMVSSGLAWYTNDEYNHGGVGQPVSEGAICIKNPQGLSYHEVACLYGQQRLSGPECYFVRGVKGFTISRFCCEHNRWIPVTKPSMEPLTGRVVPMLIAPCETRYPCLTLPRIIKGLQALSVLNDAVRGRYRTVTRQVAEVIEQPKQVGVLVGEALHLSLSANVRACQIITPLVGTHKACWACGLDTMRRVRHSGGRLPIRDALMQAARARVATDYSNPGVLVGFTTKGDSPDGRRRHLQIGVRIRWETHRIVGLSLECVEPKEKKRWFCTLREALSLVLGSDIVGDVGVILWAFTEYIKLSAESLLRSVRVLGADRRAIRPRLSRSLVEELLGSLLGLRTAYGVDSLSNSLWSNQGQVGEAYKMIHAQASGSEGEPVSAHTNTNTSLEERHPADTICCSRSCAVCARWRICNACAVDQSPGVRARAASGEWISSLATGDCNNSRETWNIECSSGSPRFSNADKQELGERLHHTDTAGTVLSADASTRIRRQVVEENYRGGLSAQALGLPLGVSYLPDSHRPSMSTTQGDQYASEQMWGDLSRKHIAVLTMPDPDSEAHNVLGGGGLTKRTELARQRRVVPP